MLGDITTHLYRHGFRQAKSNIRNVSLFFQSPEPNILDFCILINNTGNSSINTEFVTSLCKSIERNFLLQGTQKINFFFLIVSDYIERDKSFLEQGYPFWIIDSLEKRILVYDNQPDDFYNLKKPLEEVLTIKPKPFIIKNFKNFPIATLVLVLINILAYLITNSLAEGNMSAFIFYNGGAYWRLIFEEKEVYRLFTCMFLHFSADHLINNMVTLAIIGQQSERFLGHLRFVIIYLLSGIGASIMSSIYYMNNMHNEIALSAGASGAIFGILGALIIVTLLYKEYRKQIHPVNIIILAFLSISNGLLLDTVDNVGHISGLMFGIIITFISCLCRKNIIK